MTTVEDIIRAIYERPEVREQVRRAVLTDELLSLPQKIAEIATMVQSNTKQIAELTARFDDLTATVQSNTRQIAELTAIVQSNTKKIVELTIMVQNNARQIAELTATVQSIAKVQAQHTADIGMLVGDRLERRIATIVPPRLSQTIGLRRTRVMYHPNLMPGSETEFISRVEDAADAGVITDDQEDRIKQTDLIMRSRRKSDGSRVWIAVEASGTIGLRDIWRAPETAAALRAVFDEDAIAVVVGYRIRDEDRARAKASGAIVLIENKYQT